MHRRAWDPHMVTGDATPRRPGLRDAPSAPTPQRTSDEGWSCSPAPVRPLVLLSAIGTLARDMSTHSQIYLY